MPPKTKENVILDNIWNEIISALMSKSNMLAGKRKKKVLGVSAFTEPEIQVR